MNDLIELGIVTAIIENITTREDFDPADGVLEIDCGTGMIAAALKEVGVNKYHGVSNSSEMVAAAKSNVKGYSRRFHVADTSSADALNHKHDLIIAVQGAVPYDVIPAGTKLIAITRNEKSWGMCCMKLAEYFASGATTVQHGDLFLTIGVRK